ncbi:uncharacterized protein si:ch211-245h14.1 [Mugil cephalus]|uniref:uncharacterized protein si:ch211-245h14.1 n=1 Tax=Mugil cephalus TaxID=48193 RepID=UPI001FB5C587|nr:uncharacterized protein si:ch211-245h14.1 [Mugil cephalus]XP_047429016.1 uncharacterized protein si:ch211-245h14.1 [Mugil cephalus]
MSILLKKIKAAYPKAVSTLEEADIRTDLDIQSLTRDDLRDLFPSPSHFKMRRNILEIIHKERPINTVLKELKDFIPEESFRAALTNNGVLVDYLNILKSVKSQMDNVQSFLDAHIDLLDISKTGQEPDKGFGTSTSTSTSTPAPRGPMESHSDQKHGHAQETYGAASGSSQSHTTSSVGTSKDKSEGHPQGAYGKFSRESLHQYREVRYQTAVSGNTFDAHLQLMENVKAQVKDEALLTECSQDGDVVILFCPISSRIGTDVAAAMTNQSDTGPGSSSSVTCGPLEPHSGQTEGHPQGAHVAASGSNSSAICGPEESHDTRIDGNAQVPRVMYQMVVTGETFNAHTQLMDNVNTQVKDQIQLTECSQDSRVIIVFCPNSSRIGTDISSAMTDVPGDEPVILVVMHYTQVVKSVQFRRRCPDYPNVVLLVNILYHDKVGGLLKCQENNNAVCEIQNKLLEYSVPRVKYT